MYEDDNAEYVNSYDDISDAYTYDNAEYVNSYDDISDAYTYENPESVGSYDDISDAYTYDNPDFADSYDTSDLNPTSSVDVTAGMTPVELAALKKYMESQSNANTTGGGPGPSTDYLASLIAAVKSGAISTDAIKNLSSSVQAAVNKGLTTTPAATSATSPSLIDKIGDFLKTSTGQAVGIGGLAALLGSMGNRGVGDIYKGYQGGIPNLSASRTMNAIPTTSVDAAGKTVARRPGQGGITYFTPMQYTPVVSKPVTPADTTSPATTTDVVKKAMGGIAGYAMGGLGSLGNYSDGGRLLRGPGDGVSDSIPATIGQKQPARLADGEFVIPARVVSEIGNGSTEAGARKLYAMMDRVQKARRKTLKNVAANSRADKYLPA
jgi:hypothetical protein